jgi:two-component system, LytTR family, response regulator
MIDCIIIDDEAKARNLLQAVIKDYCPTLNVLELCDNLPNGIKAIKKHKPQLIFLDIEMPGHSGLEILDFFEEEEINFDIIFTTAYNQYALQAFQFSAIDYLLKPIQHSLLIDAVARYTNNVNKKNRQQLLQLKDNLVPGVPWQDKKIIVPSAQTLFFFKPENIVMIKGEGAYSELYLIDGSKLLASKNLKHFEDMLQTIPVFFRCHKSYIININYLDNYVKSDGGYLTIHKNLTASISVDKSDELLKLLGV